MLPLFYISEIIIHAMLKWFFMPSSKKPLAFEKSLQELENLVQILEQGSLPLEEALEKFSKGVQLIQQCQNALQAADQKIQILIKKDEKESLVPFEAEKLSDSTLPS